MKSEKLNKMLAIAKKYPRISQTKDTCPLSCSTCYHCLEVDWYSAAESQEDVLKLEQIESELGYVFCRG